MSWPLIAVIVCVIVYRVTENRMISWMKKNCCINLVARPLIPLNSSTSSSDKKLCFQFMKPPNYLPFLKVLRLDSLALCLNFYLNALLIQKQKYYWL